ncbi:MAG TPA: potassium channel protein [Acidimicrobiia bacterium]|jgi:voltage-gated potassium channel
MRRLIPTGTTGSWSRLFLALVALTSVIVVGTIGYVVLGFGWLDALYQTVTTVATVGFREVRPLSDAGKIFTIALIMVGVGTALYTFGVVLETLIEGRLFELFGRRRMERAIAGMNGHVVVCGWGRVGHAITRYVAGAGQDVVVVDTDATRLTDLRYPSVAGDATDDATLLRAGVDRARALVAAVDTDAANLFVTLSARALKPDLFIVARARMDATEEKLLRAGANRVVNPQSIGGARMAAFVLQPAVAEFLDVVMHDGSLEFRLEEVRVPESSGLVGATIRDAQLRDRTGALVLAIRGADGEFVTNPEPDAKLAGGQLLIAIGTAVQLDALSSMVGGAVG